VAGAEDGLAAKDGTGIPADAEMGDPAEGVVAGVAKARAARNNKE